MKITTRLATIFNPTARKLIEAGFVDPCDGKLTKDGRGAMWSILVELHKDALVKLAEEAIAENEAEAAKCCK